MPSDVRSLYASGHYREASSLHNRGSTHSTQAPLHYWLGRGFYERLIIRAISSFEDAVALEPARSEYHEWLGRAYGRKAEETNFFSAFSSLALARKTNRGATAVRLDPANLRAGATIFATC